MKGGEKLTQITFLGNKTREQPQATNYQLTLGRGLKALSSLFWQRTLRWCGKWVKAHPKSHNRSGRLLLLLPASPSVCQQQPRGAIPSLTEYFGGSWSSIKSKRRAPKCEHATWGPMAESSLLMGGASFFYEGLLLFLSHLL